jgi:hypothetical protein
VIFAQQGKGEDISGPKVSDDDGEDFDVELGHITK